ncbi:MAG TPA: hypothetical protein PKN30_15790, partial [Flavobacteriales bacterium]|nr:hypothetical protein [Flavobacteriales bacterium]
YFVTIGGDTVRSVALNLARRESDLRTYTADELREQLTALGLTSYQVLDEAGGDLSLRLNELDQGQKLWKWFILLALLFLLAEVFQIRNTR